MSLVLTRTQNIRSFSEIDQFVTRPSRYGALDLFMRETENPSGILSHDLIEKAYASIGSTLETPVFDYDAGVTIGSTRSVTIADDLNTSKMVSFSFTTYSWGFTVTPALHHNNEIKMQQDFEESFKKYLYKFAAELDNAAIAALEANKTAIIGDALEYSKYADTLVVPWSKRELIMGDIEPMMNSNDFYSQLHLLGNTGLQSIIGRLSEHGLYNDQNKQLQYNDKILHFSNRLTNPEGKYASGIAIHPGSIGMLFRFEREVLYNTTMADGTEWGQMVLPMINVPVGTYFYESKGDFNALAGAATADMDRVRKEHYGFAVDVCFVTAYNTNSSLYASPYLKFTINSETTSADAVAPAVSTVVSTTKTGAVITFSEALCSDQAGTLLTGDVSAYITTPATGSTTCVLTTATADATGKVWTIVNVAGDVAATDTFDLAAAVYDANGNALASGTSILEMNAGATAWEKP